MTAASSSTAIDRAALVRRSLLELVAEHGFHGASMNLVAKRAGVAVGTAYVHYRSKEELVEAAYVEAKAALSAAVVVQVSMAQSPETRFLTIWRNTYRYLSEDPLTAQFLVQVDTSPMGADLAEIVISEENELSKQVAAPDMLALLVDLPLRVLYQLALLPAVRLAATNQDLNESQLESVARGCWRAITTPSTLDKSNA